MKWTSGLLPGLIVISTVGVAALAGCSKQSDALLAEYTVWQDDGYKQGVYSGKQFDDLSEVDKEFISAFVGQCQAESVDDAIVLLYPDLTSMAEIAENDKTGFCSDCATLQLMNDEVSTSDFVKQYFVSVLNTSSVERGRVDVGTVEDSYLNTDKIASVVGEILAFDYDAVFDACRSTESTESVESTESLGEAEKNSSVLEREVGDDFVINTDNGLALVYDVSIATGEDALNCINALSPANNFSSSDAVYFVQYRVKNLSKSAMIVKDCFAMVDENGYQLEMTNNISGLKGIASIEPGESSSMTSLLAGPADASVCWLNNDRNSISYKINVVR